MKRKGTPERPRGYERQYHDPYLPHLGPGETAVCTGCHAVFLRRHWRFDEPLYTQLARRRDTRRLTCPACKKIEDGYFEGEVTLVSGPFLDSHRQEILNLIRNQEGRAKGEINPLERIVAIDKDNGRLVVRTTNEKLAQRIGRELRKAYQGRTVYRWSENNRRLRVTWARE